jgi:hypothetical protein
LVDICLPVIPPSYSVLIYHILGEGVTIIFLT